MSTEVATPGSTTTATTVCDACPHPDSAHDRISRRYCAATMAAASTRDCICAGQ